MILVNVDSRIILNKKIIHFKMRTERDRDSGKLAENFSLWGMTDVQN